MTGARKYKSKLRTYSTTVVNKNKQNDTSQKNENDTVSTVTDKIARLRLEQSRAEANRRRQQQQSSSSHTLRSEPVITSGHIPPWNVIENRQEIEITADVLIANRRHLPGPPPPPSWTRSRVRHALTNTNNNVPKDILLQQRRKRLKQYDFYFSSLVALSAKQLYFLLYDHHASSYYKKQFKSLPIHTKQMILYEWSCLGGLTTTQFDLFSKTEYEELWLEASKITIEHFVKSFWQVTEIDTPLSIKNVIDDNDSSIVDDWEQLAENDENENESINVPAFLIRLDQPDTSEQYLHLNQIVSLLRPDIIHHHQNYGKKVRVNLPTYSISSPFLGYTLVSLNISFMQLSTTTTKSSTLTGSSTLSWITFAHLLTTTLPNLLWLYTAGCFDEIQGPKAISILSHGLRKLRFWDIGYHYWLLHMNVLTSIIDWHHDLKELKTLCLTPSSNTVAINNDNSNTNTDHQIILDLSRWFYINGLSRIRILWNKI